MLGYDDSLDAFGVHGVGGIIGALLTGVFARRKRHRRLRRQSCYRAGQGRDQSTLLYSGVGAVSCCCKIIDMVMGLRVPEEEEREGLDITCTATRRVSTVPRTRAREAR